MAKPKKNARPLPRRARKSPEPPLPAPAPKTPVWRITPEQQIVGAVFLGKVRDYYSHVRAIALVLEAPLAVGDTIRIKGHTTDLTQKIERIELEHQSVQSAVSGEGVGIKVADRVRIGDAVYKI